MGSETSLVRSRRGRSTHDREPAGGLQGGHPETRAGLPPIWPNRRGIRRQSGAGCLLHGFESRWGRCDCSRISWGFGGIVLLTVRVAGQNPERRERQGREGAPSTAVSRTGTFVGTMFAITGRRWSTKLLKQASGERPTIGIAHLRPIDRAAASARSLGSRLLSRLLTVYVLALPYSMRSHYDGAGGIAMRLDSKLTHDQLAAKADGAAKRMLNLNSRREVYAKLDAGELRGTLVETRFASFRVLLREEKAK